MFSIQEMNEIRQKSSKEQLEFFIEIQNYIVRNLTKEERKLYKNNIVKIDRNDIIKKIEYVFEWIEIAKLKERLNYHFEFIQKFFPEEYESILKQYSNTFPDQREFFLEKEIRRLKAILQYKLQNDIMTIKLQIKQEVSEGIFYDIETKLNKFDNNEKKLEILRKIKVRLNL